ncbi:nuclear transport factor 2 family protein [Methylocystis heyeri]|uniref:nuclear transport factor 2 family protein n=1 Tax=Methylocystis heyeri TaxID=391905 RepID=UPI001FE4A9AE|nr:nuclear transport factor 2 family protein [Methylocystis heyeri]
MTDDKDQILAANKAYYDAFCARSNEAMSSIWAQEDVSCIHPGWPVLIGRRAVLSSYGDIFRNPMQEPLRHGDETVVAAGEEARVFCVESVGGSSLVATNCFRRIEGRWLMIHHQASPLATAAPEAPPRKTMH